MRNSFEQAKSRRHLTVKVENKTMTAKADLKGESKTVLAYPRHLCNPIKLTPMVEFVTAPADLRLQRVPNGE